ncbi:Inactive cytochrome P450 76AD1 [Bienertia sinuspersici]
MLVPLEIISWPIIRSIQLLGDKPRLAITELSKRYGPIMTLNGIPVDIGKAAFITTLNFMLNTFFPIDLASHVSSNSLEFKDLVWSVMEEDGRPNLSDYLPL